MPNFRRYFVPGGTFFFTVVTAGREPIFDSEDARSLLRRSFRAEREIRPFAVDAIVLLPDHLHTKWTLPRNDHDFSMRWADLKGRFTRDWLALGGAERVVSEAAQRERRRGVWQPRFFEHMIRDEEDLSSHLDYLHFNPVKHGKALCPKDWPWSSFHRFVRSGDYPRDWGCGTAEIRPQFPSEMESRLE